MNADIEPFDDFTEQLPYDFDLMRELRKQPSTLLIEHLEPGAWAHNSQTGRTMFRCPECRNADAAADDSDELVWWCECGATGTRFGLMRRVLESPDALRRALAHIEGAYEALSRGEVR